MSLYKIYGFAVKGFEAVRERFEYNFTKGIEENAQLCVYVNGEKVVDLWGVLDDTNGYDGDSTTTIFSSGKVLASICMATLVEKNLLDYSDQVVKHWPEYGNVDKDKGSITIADILRHEGGMPMFSKTMSLSDIQPENIKKNSLGKIVEKEKLCYPPPKAGTTRQYHTVSRGIILNEIFRRVDPQHRTIGECLREDISEPLGANTVIGLKYEELQNSFNMSLLPVPIMTLQSTLPSMVRKVEPSLADLIKMGANLLPVRKTLAFLEPFTNMTDAEDILTKFTYTVVKTGEIPSGNAQSSARGLARIAAMMANRGEIDGIRVLSEETWNALHANSKDLKLYPFDDITSFTQGGVNVFKTVDNPSSSFNRHNNTCRKEFVGWMGLGGSVLQWHAAYNIGFGYVPTFLAYEDLSNTRGAFLQQKVVECVQQTMGDRWEQIE